MIAFRGTIVRWLTVLVVLMIDNVVAGQQPAVTVGPETEKRFPPLTLPAGFKATLFACDPLAEYPSVIALGPRSGTLYVAHDYVTGLGIEIVRRDEIRLLEDTDGDGYADKSTVFAGEFNSIQGLAYHDGTVFTMHAPLLTSLRDTNGDGIADQRRDLLSGLGLPPETNTTRLHCANGVVAGHDGWLYLALGDNGVDVPRPEGDRLVFHGGGILRCRPDGRDLHVFARGLRNIYDVVLDDEQNVFVRDNENDGGDYMIRVCHSFFGADHGYPYLYAEHPDEALRPMADLGRGSSAGGVCYLETAFPEDWRGRLFFCEWGRAVVAYPRQASQSGFATTREIDFAAGAANDPYGFKPTDLVVDRDGSLLISDWGDGQRPKRGRARIYRVTWNGAGNRTANTVTTANPAERNSRVAELNSPSFHVRVAAQMALQHDGAKSLDEVRRALRDKTLNKWGQSHAVWLISQLAGREAITELLALTEGEFDAAVRAQAIRAIADLCDPVFVEGKLAVGRGDVAIAQRLARLGTNAEPRIVLEVIVTLGRLRWMETPTWLRDNLPQPDAALTHAAIQSLRSCDNWQDVLKLLDEPEPIRSLALKAVVERADAVVVDDITRRMEREPIASRRQEFALTLARVHRRPGPWTYWGYRPPPRPANTVDWERTTEIARTLNRTLEDSDRNVRLAILQKMQREQVPLEVSPVNRWIVAERDVKYLAPLLDAVAKISAAETRDVLASVIRERSYAESIRTTALSTLAAQLDANSESRILELIGEVEDGPVLAELLRELPKRRRLDGGQILLSKLDSTDASVRASALEALGDLQIAAATSRVPQLLRDNDVRVRRSAAAAAGKLAAMESVEQLVPMSRDPDAATRSAALASLRLLKSPAAAASAVAALNDPVTQVAAIDYLAEFGGPETNPLIAVAATSRSLEVLTALVRALARWQERWSTEPQRFQDIQSAIAKVQGTSGLLLHWKLRGSMPVKDAGPVVESLLNPASGPNSNFPDSAWRTVVTEGPQSTLKLVAATDQQPVWLAVTEVHVAEPLTVQFLAGSSAPFRMWLNGRSLHEHDSAGAFQAEAVRIRGELQRGSNRLVVKLIAADSAAQFQLRFRPLSTSADHERIAQFALQNTGNIERGRELFVNAEKSLCLKCHRWQKLGGNIGPDLTEVGSRFSRIHVIESILEPSRTIAPSYETVTVALTSGLVLNGVKIAEDQQTLTLGDDQGKVHTIVNTTIDERHIQPRSTMPDGLEKKLTDREFLDLVTFLIAQKKGEAKTN